MVVEQCEDCRLVLAALEELEPYLDSKVLFWRISSLNLPLSPGNLLLALKKTSLIDAGQMQREGALLETIITERRSAWQQRIILEIPARLTQWKNTMHDYLEDGKLDPTFHYHVRVRVVLELLMQECTYPQAAGVKELEKLDEMLLHLITPGDFIWEEELREGFPQDKYWFLYAGLKG